MQGILLAGSRGCLQGNVLQRSRMTRVHVQSFGLSHCKSDPASFVEHGAPEHAAGTRSLRRDRSFAPKLRGGRLYGLMLNATDVHQLLDSISHVGLVPSRVDAIGIEVASEQDRMYNQRLVDGAGGSLGGSGGQDQQQRGRKVFPLTNLELTTAFLAHEDQINLLQHQMAMVYKFSQSQDFAQILLDAVKDWQKAHKPGVAHPEGSCSTAVAKALLSEITRSRTPSTVDRATPVTDCSFWSVRKANDSASEPRVALPERRSLVAMPPVNWAAQQVQAYARAVSYAALIHTLEGHPGLVIKCPARTGEAHLLHKEAKRLSQLPNIATVNFIPMVEGTRALMEWLHPLDIQDLKAAHMERLRSDMVSALQTLHGCGIVHADIHRRNIMVRQNPPSFVLIDLGGTAGESIYPLSLGYGAIGQGGTLDCPPHETGPFPIRAGKGDYHRLAMTLRHEIMDVIQPMLLRADNLSIAKPDPSLLVRGLNALVGDVWAKDRDVTFRTQLVKSRLGVDVSPTWVHQNWSYNVAGLFRVCSLEGYTVETGILDGMDETYKMFALPERIDSLLCRHVLDEEPLDNLKNLWKYIKQQQKRNRIRNKYQQRLCKLSMFQKQKDFPKLKGKASEIKGLCATFVDMWNYFVLDTEEYRKLAVLLKLNKEFEDVLSQYPVSQGYFALPADAARKLVQCEGPARGAGTGTEEPKQEQEGEKRFLELPPLSRAAQDREEPKQEPFLMDHRELEAREEASFKLNVKVHGATMPPASMVDVVEQDPKQEQVDLIGGDPNMALYRYSGTRQGSMDIQGGMYQSVLTYLLDACKQSSRCMPFCIPRAQHCSANSLLLLKQYEDALGQQHRGCRKIDWNTFPGLDPMVATVLEWGHSLTDDQWAVLPADQKEFKLNVSEWLLNSTSANDLLNDRDHDSHTPLLLTVHATHYSPGRARAMNRNPETLQEKAERRKQIQKENKVLALVLQPLVHNVLLNLLILQ
ncbi:unnamed protein product, partial [Symbiodinium sp. KB8]